MKLNISPSYHYNQKATIKNWVVNFIIKNRIKSLIDIGAGLPQTALYFKSAVSDYIAVEKDRDKVKKLKSFGIDVIANTFPCSIIGKYDLVLVSHAIPENIIDYNNFLESTWNLVANKGYLIIITFKGVSDSMSEIRAELRNKSIEPFEKEKFDKIMEILNTLGKPRISKMTSIETSDEIKDIMLSISTSLNDYKTEKFKNKLQFIIQSRFTIGKRYQFPHEHNIVIVQKQ